MASIDKKQVEYLAGLARISLTTEEVERFEKDLQKILDYVEELKQVPTDGLPEVAQVTGLKNMFRTDEPRPTGPDLSEKLIQAFPEQQDNYLKVKAIFE